MSGEGEQPPDKTKIEKRLKELEAKLKAAEEESAPKKEVEAWKKRISELESTLTQYREELETAKRTIKDLQAPLRDVEAKLRGIVGEAGQLSLQYGGYEITVEDKQRFPWNALMDTLLDCSFDVWVKRKNEHTVVTCRPRPV